MTAFRTGPFLTGVGGGFHRTNSAVKSFPPHTLSWCRSFWNAQACTLGPQTITGCAEMNSSHICVLLVMGNPVAQTRSLGLFSEAVRFCTAIWAISSRAQLAQ
jgi:hypothetical protein